MRTQFSSPGLTTSPYLTQSPTTVYQGGPAPISPAPITTPAPVYTPGATLSGTIQPSPTWDPYAQPGMIQQAPAAPMYSPYGAYDPNCPPAAIAAAPAQRRLLEQVRLQHTWLGGDDGDDLDINTSEISASFGFPIIYSQPSLFLTPGINIHVVDGPDSAVTFGADLPGQLYDAFLETSWQPQITPWLSADVAFRLNVSSDFKESVDANSLRYTGRGFGIVTLSQQWQLAAGILYYDRLRVKILPAGGLIWTPNADTRWEILFPRPKLAQRLTTIGNSDVWGYVAAEYGGGQWRIERVAGFEDDVNYNDYRVGLGLEWMTLSGTRGLVEGGYVFERELIYRSATPTVEPDDTFYLRAGVTF